MKAATLFIVVPLHTSSGGQYACGDSHIIAISSSSGINSGGGVQGQYIPDPYIFQPNIPDPSQF